MMKINSQFSIDLTNTGVQVFDLGDTDTLWFPDGYIDPNLMGVINPPDAQVIVWVNDQATQPLLMGCRNCAVRSISGVGLKKLFVKVLYFVPHPGISSLNRLVFGTGKCVDLSFGSANPPDQLPLYAG